MYIFAAASTLHNLPFSIYIPSTLANPLTSAALPRPALLPPPCT